MKSLRHQYGSVIVETCLSNIRKSLASQHTLVVSFLLDEHQ